MNQLLRFHDPTLPQPARAGASTQAGNNALTDRARNSRQSAGFDAELRKKHSLSEPRSAIKGEERSTDRAAEAPSRSDPQGRADSDEPASDAAGTDTERDSVRAEDGRPEGSAAETSARDEDTSGDIEPVEPSDSNAASPQESDGASPETSADVVRASEVKPQTILSLNRLLLQGTPVSLDLSVDARARLTSESSPESLGSSDRRGGGTVREEGVQSARSTGSNSKDPVEHTRSASGGYDPSSQSAGVEGRSTMGARTDPHQRQSNETAEPRSDVGADATRAASNTPVTPRTTRSDAGAQAALARLGALADAARSRPQTERYEGRQSAPPVPGVAVSAAAGKSGGASLGGGANASNSASQPPADRSSTEAQVAQQLGRGLAAALKKGEGELTLRLRPESLGQVRVRIDLREDSAEGAGRQIAARFEVERPIARKVLEQALPELRHALQLRGFQVGSLEVHEASEFGSHTQDSTGSHAPDQVGTPRASGEQVHASRPEGDGRQEGWIGGESALDPDGFGSGGDPNQRGEGDSGWSGRNEGASPSGSEVAGLEDGATAPSLPARSAGWYQNSAAAGGAVRLVIDAIA